MEKRAKEREVFDRDRLVEFEVACNNGDATGCNSLGEWFGVLNGEFEKAADIFRPNCYERSNGNSCFHYGLLHGKCVSVMLSCCLCVFVFSSFACLTVSGVQPATGCRRRPSLTPPRLLRGAASWETKTVAI